MTFYRYSRDTSFRFMFFIPPRSCVPGQSTNISRTTQKIVITLRHDTVNNKLGDTTDSIFERFDFEQEIEGTRESNEDIKQPK